MEYKKIEDYMKYIAAIYCLLLVLTGCATNYSNVSPESVAQKVVIKNSGFDSHKTYFGPDHETSTSRGLFTDYEHVKLVAYEDKKSGKISYKLRISILYSGGWRFYDSASFLGGTHVDLHNNSRDVNFCTGGLCSYTEVMDIAISEERLTDYLDNDLIFRLNARTGHENIIEISSNYVAGFYSTIH
ncbi:hypothetical protein GP2143_03268 [marine gamma proteobacterium HTCC2143]|uniref:Lipoprotein n=1 Tax=marine gamma proteobacterium HTCC2143 TaxID=247633 RepID=A0YD05_9GAMM|nr:hypothetical protein GP2143_03268 [marine gamma proteobacterium HTCC2143]